MLPSQYRMTHTDMREERKKAGEYHSPHFLCKVYKKKDVPHTKYAVVVSGKIAKQAVLRNKVKRRVYSIIQKKANLSKPYYVVFIAKKGSPTLSFSETEIEIQTLLDKAHLL